MYAQRLFTAARRQFRFWHGDLRLVQIHTPFACIGFSRQCFATAPRRDNSAWDSTSLQFINYVLAPAAGILDYLWNGLVDLASQLIREPPLQTIPGIQPDSSNPSGPETPRHPGSETIEIQVFSNPSTNDECADNAIGAFEDGGRCDIDAIKIVYALDCGNEAQNAAIKKLLADTVQYGAISTIVDDDCGVLFLTGSLTDEGAEVMRNTYGVLAVVSDITLVPEDLSIVLFTAKSVEIKSFKFLSRCKNKLRNVTFWCSNPRQLQSLPSFQVPQTVKPLSITCTTLLLEKVLPFTSSTVVSIHHTPNSVLVLSKDGSMPMASPKRRLMMIPV